MKHLTTLEKGVFALGLVFVVVGTCMMIHPTEGVLFHPGPDRFSNISDRSQPEYVSKRGCRIYGAIAVTLGIGISSLALYRGKN